MCVLPPKGSLSIDTVLEDRTQRVFNGQKSFTRIYKRTHAIPPSNIPVSTRPPRITAPTEVESTLEDERNERREENNKTEGSGRSSGRRSVHLADVQGN